MYCKICGAKLGENVSFCTQCGTRIEKPDNGDITARPAVTEAEVIAKTAFTTSAPAAETEQEKPLTEAADVITETAGGVSEGVFAAAADNSAAAGIQTGMASADIPAAPAPVVKEKPFFGVGALVFCLVLIGILSLSTGAFAGLYFSLLTR